MSQTEIIEYYGKSLLWQETYHTDATILFLISEINRRDLTDGDRFPLSETAIAEALGESRAVVSRAWSEL